MAVELDKKVVVMNVFEEDKEFLTSNIALEKFLVLKHQKIAKKQEDIVHLIRLEIEEQFKKDSEPVKKGK